MVTVCFENKDETLEGKSAAAEAAKALLDAGADIVGMNCLRPPEHTLGAMEQMRKAVSGYLACQPVAYRTPQATNPISPACRNSLWGSIPCNSPVRKWATTLSGLVKSGSTTSVPVAVRSRSMFGRWRAPSGSSAKMAESGKKAAKNPCRPTSTTGTTKWSARRGKSEMPQSRKKGQPPRLALRIWERRKNSMLRTTTVGPGTNLLNGPAAAARQFQAKSMSPPPASCHGCFIELSFYC